VPGGRVVGMTEKRRVEALATREGNWWVVRVEGVGTTQARRLGEVEEMAADLVATLEGLDASRVAVDVTVSLADELDREVADARRAVADAEQAQLEAGRRQRRLVASLRGRDLSVAEVAEVLGVSPGRVSQLSRPAGKRNRRTAVAGRVAAPPSGERRTG
jgi:predicted XRE-type DNA-binding protein